MSTMSEDVNPTDGTVDRGVPSEGEESAVACRSRDMRTPASACALQLQPPNLYRRVVPHNFKGRHFNVELNPRLVSHLLGCE